MAGIDTLTAGYAELVEGPDARNLGTFTPEPHFERLLNLRLTNPANFEQLARVHRTALGYYVENRIASGYVPDGFDLVAVDIARMQTREPARYAQLHEGVRADVDRYLGSLTELERKELELKLLKQGT